VQSVLFAFSIIIVALITLGGPGSFSEQPVLRQNLAAVFINDSNVVEFVGTSENPPPVSGVGATTEPPPSSTSNQQSTSPANAPGDANSSSSGENSTAVTGGAQESTIESVVVSSNSSDGNAGELVTLDTENNGGAEVVLSVEDIFAALVGAAAVVGLNPSETGGGGALTLYGDRVREAFTLQGIASIEIPGRVELLASHRAGEAVFSRSDFTLFVSSAILADEYLDEVKYFSGTLSIRYRAPGRLFGFVPLRYPIRVEAGFQSGTLASLEVRFPWYSFLLAKGITKDAFSTKLDRTITEEIDGFVEEYDVATHAFIAAGDTLSLTFGGF